MEEQSSSSSSAAGPTAGNTCVVTLEQFQYIWRNYMEEINRIAIQNGVKITHEVKLNFQANQRDGNPEKALSEFENLKQKCFLEICGPMNTMDTVQKDEPKPLHSPSPEEPTESEPEQGRDAEDKSLNETQETFGETSWGTQNTTLNESVKVNLVDAGLTLEERHWMQLTTHAGEEFANLKAKFGVDFKESDKSKGKVTVKAYYRGTGGKELLENNAIRALIRLLQKRATSPSIAEGDKYYPSGSSSSWWNPSSSWWNPSSAVSVREGASSGQVLNEKPANGMYNADAYMGGATSGDNTVEACSICYEAMKNMKQLKCKHKFCGGCLTKSVESMGPVCPTCRDVFGVMTGDQPRGDMTFSVSKDTLEGYRKWGTIIIKYVIPDGIQTVNTLLETFQDAISISCSLFYLNF